MTKVLEKESVRSVRAEGSVNFDVPDRGLAEIEAMEAELMGTEKTGELSKEPEKKVEVKVESESVEGEPEKTETETKVVDKDDKVDKVDPYAMLKEQTPFDKPEDLIKTYKDDKAYIDKVSQENLRLKQELEKRAKPETETGETYLTKAEAETLAKEKAEEILNEKLQLLAKKESEDDVQKTVLSHYQDVIKLPDFKDNEQKIQGIVNFCEQKYPAFFNSGNPFKVAYELAKAPEVMAVYNEKPELFDLGVQGFDIAKQLAKSSPEIQEKYRLEAIAEGKKKQIQNAKSRVATGGIKTEVKTSYDKGNITSLKSDIERMAKELGDSNPFGN